MPKKDEIKEVKPNKKEDLTNEIIDELNETIKGKVKEEIVSDIKSSFDENYKQDLKDSIKDAVMGDIRKEISKEQKKLGRAKSFKIFRLYIYLLIVVGTLLYILFRLYETDNLTVIDEAYTRKTTARESSSETTTTSTTQPVKDAEFYIKNFGYLMDNVKISNVELVKGNTIISSLGIEEKIVMAYLNVLKESISTDGIIHTLAEDVLIDSYKNIFGTDDGYSPVNFSVNGFNYAYSSTNKTYMAIGDEDLSQSVVNNILVNGYEEGDTIVLETRAYVIKDGWVYNPNNMNYRIMSASDDADFTRIQDRLLSVLYKFSKVDGEYRLVSINKK